MLQQASLTGGHSAGRNRPGPGDRQAISAEAGKLIYVHVRKAGLARVADLVPPELHLLTPTLQVRGSTAPPP